MSRPASLVAALPGLGRLLRRFRPYLRKHTALGAGAFAALFAEVAVRILEPWPLRYIFDHVLIPAVTDVPVEAGAGGLGWSLGLAIGAIIGLAIARAVFAYLSTIGFALMGQRVLTEVRADLFSHIQRLSLEFHTRARGGDLTVRLIGDVGLLKEVLVTAALPLLGNVLILVGMIAVMFWMNPSLALVAVSVLPLFWLRSVRLSGRMRSVSRDQRRREGAMAATAAEAFSGIRVVQALSLENTFSQTFGAQNRKSLREGAKAKRLEANLERTVDVLTALSTAMVLGFGARLVVQQVLTPGDLLVFATYLKNAFKPVRDFAKYTGRMAKASAAGERIIDLLNEEPGVRESANALPLLSVRGHVRFAGVGFAYADGKEVLREVDFEVPPSRMVAIVGESGIGKSTIGSLLLRLYDPLHGRILLDGHDLRNLSIESLRRQISVVLQDPTLFAVSIRENIAYGAPGCTEEEIIEAARMARADEFIRALPMGYDTVLGERGVTLSSGQRQRISLARAAVRRAPLLVLDEPTTGLDEVNERAVIAAIDNLARNATTLLITHDLELASRADAVLYLEGGTIVERGSHLELLVSEGRYATMYHLQCARHPSARETGSMHALSL